MIFEKGIYSGNIVVYENSSFCEKYLEEGTSISLEVDMNKRILYFFIGDELFPGCVSNIPDNVYFGVYYYFIFIFFSFVIIICYSSI
jgi:hypothetical protein